jgi:hypothetical protein
VLTFIVVFGLFAAPPHIGHLITTASASTPLMTAQPAGVDAPASENDNESQDPSCTSGDPRKQKQCHFNQPNTVDDNDNTANVVADQPPTLRLGVSNYDPHDGDTISIVLAASGKAVDQVWWWVPDYASENDNGNDNESFAADFHVTGCDGEDTCTRTSDMRTPFADTFTIHAKARDRQGRESPEVVTEVRVHD